MRLLKRGPADSRRAGPLALGVANNRASCDRRGRLSALAGGGAFRAISRACAAEPLSTPPPAAIGS
jgi:hypothetical protein